MEALLVVMDSLAAPRPETDGIKDTRSTAARHHDGLLDALNRLLVDGGLPSTNGVSATILLTMTEDQLRQHATDAASEQLDLTGETDADAAND